MYAKKLISDMDKLQQITTKYMHIEELAKYMNQVQAEAMSTKKEVNKPNLEKRWTMPSCALCEDYGRSRRIQGVRVGLENQ